MADGVFNNTSDIGDTIKQGLMLRYQAGLKAQEDARQTAMANLRARGELLGRLTLSQPGGGAAPFSDYVAALNGGVPDATAQPTPAFGAVQRADAQRDVAANKADTDMKKQGVALRSHWGQQLPTGTVKPASYFMPPELLKQYGIDPNEKIGSAQKPAGKGVGGGKSPEQTRLEALKATAASLYKQLGVASKEDANRMFSSLRNLSPEQQHIKQQLAQIDAETSKLGGVKPAGAGGGAGTLDPDQWNQKWAALTPGQSMVGLDGKTYTKR